MGAQPWPAASQRCHWYAKVTGLPPDQSPRTAVSRLPVWAVPTTVGGALASGAPPGYRAIAADPGVAPRNRSPSTAVEMPSTCHLLDHCQKVQPRLPQFAAGTSGAAALVQCATQSGYPLSEIAPLSATDVFQ